MAIVIINTPEARDTARHWVNIAPHGTRVTFRRPTRTLPQNDRMWAMLTDIAVQKDVNGKRFSPEQFKVMFMELCGHDVEFLPSLTGAGFVPWGNSTSKLDKDQMSNLIECIFAWGAENDVIWTDPSTPPPAEPSR